MAVVEKNDGWMCQWSLKVLKLTRPCESRSHVHCTLTIIDHVKIAVFNPPKPADDDKFDEKLLSLIFWMLGEINNLASRFIVHSLVEFAPQFCTIFTAPWKR